MVIPCVLQQGTLAGRETIILAQRLAIAVSNDTMVKAQVDTRFVRFLGRICTLPTLPQVSPQSVTHSCDRVQRSVSALLSLPMQCSLRISRTV